MNTGAITREERAHAECGNWNYEIQRFETKVKCPTGRASFWVKFLTVRSKTPVKCRLGWMGGFGIDWYITLAYI